MNILNLTSKQLAISTGSSEDICDKWVPYIREICKSFDITTTLRLAAFLAQIGHESSGFRTLEENLNYSAEGLANTWPNRFALVLNNGLKAKNSIGRYLPSTLAKKLARQPVLIANNVYSNRMGNADEKSGEGWKYRGRGCKQLTGKSNYAQLSLDTGIDFISNPDFLLEPAYALISAAWFWKVNNLSYFADKGDFEGLTKKINGGLIGYPQRLALYKKAIEIL